MSQSVDLPADDGRDPVECEQDLEEFDDFYETNDYVDEFEEAAANCGMLADGTCMKAGSEECDWECPFSD